MWDLTGVCLLFTCITDSTLRSDWFVLTIYMILYNRFHCETWPVCVYYIHDFVWPIPLWDLTGLCVRYTWMAEYWRLCHWPIYWHSPMLSRDHRSKLVGERLSPKISRKKNSFSKLELELFPPPLWRKWLWQGVLQFIYQQPSYFDLYQSAFRYIYIHSNLQKNWYPSLLLNKFLCMSLE